LGAIDHNDGVYCLCRSTRVQSFAEEGELQERASVDQGNVTGVVAVGRFVFAVINSEGTLHRIRISDGVMVTVRDDLDYPQDIEYLGVSLSPPPGR
jgi:hypothetical protein